MSVFKLNFTASPKTARRRIIECSDQDFVIVPDFLPIEVIRREVAKYDNGHFINYTQNLLYYQRSRIDKISDELIKKIAQKAITDFPSHETFFLITKPKEASFNSFCGWVNELKPL